MIRDRSSSSLLLFLANCRKAGIVVSVAAFIAAILFVYTPLAAFFSGKAGRIFVIVSYLLILGIVIINEYVYRLMSRQEAALKAELAHDRNIIQTVQNNIPQGIFLMDREFKILKRYSSPLVSILSYYDSELAGKNFLDILSSSLDAKQLQIMKGYFEMMFAKSKNPKVLEAANPLSEFTYKVDDRKKILNSSFYLIEEEDRDDVIIGIIQDITRDKEFKKELRKQREEQEQEMKNMFDIIQIDPLVFQDFIEDTESNFNYINFILKDHTLSAKQVVSKFYQNIHAIKSHAVILGLETFARKLHAFEDDIRMYMSMSEVTEDDILGLAIKLEELMHEKDSYLTIVKKIEAFKNSNQVDTILIHSVNLAVEKLSAETQKKVELKTGYLDMKILESKLRKPIKDILFQCVRNSIYHGIETVEERIEKNKRPQGLLEFSIINNNGSAEVTFKDDGRGLDWKKIREKYIQKHPRAKNPGKATLLSSIFAAEFTTAEAISMEAGRGIGLSLVKNLIKENHGNINVDSSESGLTIQFTLPLKK